MVEAGKWRRDPAARGQAGRAKCDPSIIFMRRFDQGRKYEHLRYTGTITVSWSVEKQMNDIWRAFDEISHIAFTIWGINRETAKKAVEVAAKQALGKSSRYYPKAPGRITFKDDGTFTL